MRTLIPGILFALTALTGVTAQALEFKAEEHYVELASPIPVATPGKIEVVELFWYGCPHCYQFESTLSPWADKLPADVTLRRVPAMFGGVWNVHGQVFLTLEAMGVEPKVHAAIFEAIHQKGYKLAKPEDMADFLATQGVDRATFLSTYDSFAVKGNVEKAKKLVKAYQISGVPALVVNGKYRFDIGSAGGNQQVLELADFLIAKERPAR